MLKTALIITLLALAANQAGAESVIHMKINDVRVSVAWENNSVKALTEKFPLTVRISVYGGSEQV